MPLLATMVEKMPLSSSDSAVVATDLNLDEVNPNIYSSRDYEKFLSYCCTLDGLKVDRRKLTPKYFDFDLGQVNDYILDINEGEAKLPCRPVDMPACFSGDNGAIYTAGGSKIQADVLIMACASLFSQAVHLPLAGQMRFAIGYRRLVLLHLRRLSVLHYFHLAAFRKAKPIVYDPKFLFSLPPMGFFDLTAACPMDQYISAITSPFKKNSKGDTIPMEKLVKQVYSEIDSTFGSKSPIVDSPKQPWYGKLMDTFDKLYETQLAQLLVKILAIMLVVTLLSQFFMFFFCALNNTFMTVSYELKPIPKERENEWFDDWTESVLEPFMQWYTGKTHDERLLEYDEYEDDEYEDDEYEDDEYEDDEYEDDEYEDDEYEDDEYEDDEYEDDEYTSN